MILRSEIVAKMKANKLRLSTKLENGYKPKTVKQMKQELKDYLEEKEKEKEISGSGMIASDISALLKKSYNSKNPADVGDYKVDKELSGQRVQVYTKNGKAFVVHRGTASAKDWMTNASLLVGFKGKRFKHARDIQNKAVAKYGAQNIITLGHSLGAYIGEKLGSDKNKSAETITLNKATLPSQIGKKIKSNQTDIRTRADPVSALYQRGKKKRTVTIKSNLINNPLKEHSVDVLDRLPQDKFIGKIN